MLSRQREIGPAPEGATLEDRLAALESGRETGEDFDRRSWFWLVLLGLVIPAAMLALGWWAA
ncbi:MAG: hypothetical protein ACHQIL_04040 [Steroidobacterales bacterium]